MRTSRLNDTVSQFAGAQERICGRFCSSCRNHRNPAGGRELKSGHNRVRWVCRACAEQYDQAQKARQEAAGARVTD